MHELLKRKLSGLKDPLVTFAQSLIRTESISLNETSAAAVVEREMRELGYDKVFADDFGNVVGILFGSGTGPTILLASHLDTVAPLSESQWDSSPWSGRLTCGTLVGLGSADCKGGLAAQVYAGALLKRTLLPLRGNVVVAGTVAEENGLSVGMRGLVGFTLRQLNLTPDFAVLGEPTELGVYCGHDGWAEFEIKLRGTITSRVVDAAQEVFTDLRHRVPTFGVEELFLHEPYIKDRQGLPEVTICVDRRLRPSDIEYQVLGNIQRETSALMHKKGPIEVGVSVCNRDEKLASGVVCNVKRYTPAWNVDPFSTLVTGARDALSAADSGFRPGRWRLDRLGMGTAGGVLMTEFRIPTVGYGPGNERQAHACGEWVKVDSIVDCAFGTAAIAHELVGIPVFGWGPDDI